MPFSEEKMSEMLEPFRYDKEAYTEEQAAHAAFILVSLFKGKKNELSEEEFRIWREEKFDNDELIIRLKKAAKQIKR